MQKNQIINFIKDDLWAIDADTLPALKGLAVKSLKLLILAGQGFVKDNCSLRASALTLYTLLSIVPVFAMLFGVAKGFGFEKKLKDQLLEHDSDQDTLILQVIDFAENMLANTQGGLVAGIGVVVLFWTIIKVIGNIEASFNHIWKVSKARTLSRKLSDYLSLMMLAPILLIAASSITVFVKAQVTGMAKSMPIPEVGSAAILQGLNFLPMLLIWILFSFMFIFMPNTKVSLKSGVIAGVIAGTLYQLVQWAYVGLQVGVSSYNAIYGSFTALPLFLIWLQLGWSIVLFGAEISCIHQNFEHYRHNDRYGDLSFMARKKVALQICQIFIKQFSSVGESLTAEQVADQIKVPIPVVLSLISDLQQCGIISEISVDEGEDARFQPACDPALVTVMFVSEALEKRGDNPVLGLDSVENFDDFKNSSIDKLDVVTENSLIKDV